MALIAVGEVQAWFTTNRLSLDAGDALPEEVNVSAKVLAEVDSRYDVSTWIDASTTPDLIRSVISAQVAGIRYREHYADQLDEITYADWLDNWASTTIKGIVDGTMPLLDATDLTTAQDASSVKFFPTDTSSVDDSAKFTMTVEF